MFLTEESRKRLLAQAGRLPHHPGVYLMKNGAGELLYIGKAVDLRSRVRSYFFDRHEDRAQIPYMLRQLQRIDWIATNTEAEALILEANLIRQNRPPYNIDLRDDKRFPYLKVTVAEEFPRLLVVRRVEKDGARYFGPYTDVLSMRSLVGFARRIFRLCDCGRDSPPVKKRPRPCINYEMGRCSGPCAGKISPEEYSSRIDSLLLFLAGKRNRLLEELTVRMKSASAAMHFEEAAQLRDQIRLIRDSKGLQQVDLRMPEVNCDVFGFHEGERHICLNVLVFREGLLQSSVPYIFSRALWDLPETTHGSVVVQYYAGGEREPPEEIVVPESGFDADALRQWVAGRFGSDRKVVVARKGTKRRLLDMAENNARLHLAQKIPPSGIEDCADLQKALRLPVLPAVIEAFDISNLGESFCVAGMVRFKSGMPDKSGYRRYKIKTVEGQNDFGMLLEAVSRRLTRLRDENKPFPDLLLIDGGKGQLNAAAQALALFENPPSIISLAKQEELLFSPALDEPVRLPATHPARRLVERIRDEVHRFAITYHRNIRGRQFKGSALEKLPGIGKATSRLLLKRFGSLERLRSAAPEEIAKIKGFSPERAARLKEQIEGISKGP